jgi:hypothetical protein
VIPIEKNTERIDWNAVKADYIAGATYGVLAKRYGLNKGVIYRIAKKGNWDELRERTRNAVETETVRRVAETAADNATLAANIKRMGLEIIAGLFQDFMTIKATEHRESNQGVTDVKRLRDLTAAYKDLCGDIVQSEADSALLQSLLALERGRND